MAKATTPPAPATPPAAPFSASAPPTAEMQAVGMSFLDVQEFAQHLLSLLQSQGQTVLDLVATGMKLVKAVTARDLLGIFTELNAATIDIQKLIDAIKAEFGIA